MGFLGDLFDDVLDLPGKIVETPSKVINRSMCSITEHDWSNWIEIGNRQVRVCEACGTKEVL